MKSYLMLLPICVIAACAGSTSSQMPEAQFETVANYRFANDLANKCPRYDIKPDATTFYANIDQQLTDGGLSAQEAQDMISGISQTRLDEYNDKIYDSIGVSPASGVQDCTMALRTVTARPDIAMYLEPVSPVQ